MRLNDMSQEEEKSFKSYFLHFSVELIACKMISDEKTPNRMNYLCKLPFGRMFATKIQPLTINWLV